MSAPWPIVTDTEAARLLACSKQTPPNWRSSLLDTQLVRGYQRARLFLPDRVDLHGEMRRLFLFSRFNPDPAEAVDDFSVGIAVEYGEGVDLRLARCNGPHSAHHNKIEDEWLPVASHVHLIREVYQRRWRYRSTWRGDGWATDAVTYADVTGAFDALALIGSLAPPPGEMWP